VLVLCCALLVPIVPFAVIGELPGERWLLADTTSSLHFGLTGAGLLALDLILPIPSSILGALLGGRLGLGLGFTFTMLGLCVGQAIGYALARMLPARFTAELPAAPSAALVFLTRPVPVFAEAVSLAAGATRMPLHVFAPSLLAGNALYALALAADGAALLPNEGLLSGPGLVLPMLLPVASYFAYRRWQRP
jgi:3-dehydroquinate synthase